MSEDLEIKSMSDCDFSYTNFVRGIGWWFDTYKHGNIKFFCVSVSIESIPVLIDVIFLERERKKLGHENYIPISFNVDRNNKVDEWYIDGHGSNKTYRLHSKGA